MRIFLSALLVALISMAAVPFPIGAATPEIPQAPVPQSADLPQVKPDTGNTPSPQATVPLDVYLSQIKQDIKDYASLNTAIVTYGLTGLGALATILGLSVGGIAYYTSRTYRSELKEKKILFDKYENELKQLLAKGQEHCQSLSDMLKEQGNEEKFDDDILVTANEKIAKGTGVEVLWGEAILAQENKQWEKAHTFWTAILGSDPNNTSALFGAALACWKIYYSRGKKLADLELLNEGKAHLQKIPDTERNLAIWNNLGSIYIDIAKLQSSNDEKIEYINHAIGCFEHAIASNKNYSLAWVNWGAALVELAKISDDNDKRNMYLNLAEEKLLLASQINPDDSKVLDNFGSLYLHRAALVGDSSEKKQYLKDAEKKLRRAVECDPKGVAGLYNLSCVEALQSNVLECVRLLQKAHEGGTLPPLSHLERDIDLDQIRHLKEFKDFIAKVEKEANSSS